MASVVSRETSFPKEAITVVLGSKLNKLCPFSEEMALMSARRMK